MDFLSSEEKIEDIENDWIILSIEEKNRLYAPWKFSVIIKVFKKNSPTNTLR